MPSPPYSSTAPRIGLDIKPLHKMREKQIRREVESPRLAWERTADSLPLQHLVVFRKAGRRDPD